MWSSTKDFPGVHQDFWVHNYDTWRCRLHFWDSGTVVFTWKSTQIQTKACSQFQLCLWITTDLSGGLPKTATVLELSVGLRKQKEQHKWPSSWTSTHRKPQTCWNSRLTQNVMCVTMYATYIIVSGLWLHITKSKQLGKWILFHVVHSIQYIHNSIISTHDESFFRYWYISLLPTSSMLCVLSGYLDPN